MVEFLVPFDSTEFDAADSGGPMPPMVPVEAQAQIFVGTEANRRLAGERESERDREAYGAPGTGGIYAVYISHIHILTRAHTNARVNTCTYACKRVHMHAPTQTHIHILSLSAFHTPPVSVLLCDLYIFHYICPYMHP